MELFFDTETSNVFNFKNPQYKDPSFPWCVQLGAVLAEDGIAYGELNLIIKADDRKIAPGAQKVHNISVELSEKIGIEEKTVAALFAKYIRSDIKLVCHNFQFDSYIMAAMLYRCGFELDANKLLFEVPYFCTMKGSTDFCKLPGRYGNYKWPKLQELHNILFKEDFIGAHDAMFDIKATMKCYYELKKRGWME